MVWRRTHFEAVFSRQHYVLFIQKCVLELKKMNKELADLIGLDNAD